MSHAWLNRAALFLAMALSSPHHRTLADGVEAPFPPDTFALLCVPDLTAAGEAHRRSALAQAWFDPTMQPFRERLATNWQTRVIEPLDRQLGIKTADLVTVLDGRLSFAVLHRGWPEQTNARPTWLLLAETRRDPDRARVLLKDLAVRQLNQGQGVRTLSLRDTEFHGFPLSLSSLDPRSILTRLLTPPIAGTTTNPPPPPTPATPATPDSAVDRTVVWIGQFQSNIVAGLDTNLIDSLLVAWNTNSLPTHFVSPGTNADLALPVDATCHGWLDLRPFVAWAQRLATATDRLEVTNSKALPMPKRSTLLQVSGLTGARSLAFSLSENTNGSFGDLRLAVPAELRTGLLKAFELDPEDCSPPPIVPANVARFQRLRLEFGRSARTLERMLTDAFPQAAGVLRFLLETAGQGNDRVDLRQELLGALGDDLVRFQLAPSTNSPPENALPPAAVVLGSTNAEQLVASLKTLSVLLPPDFTQLGEETNNGRKLFTLQFGESRRHNPSPHPVNTWKLAAGSNAAVFATEVPLLDACLATNPTAPPLRDLNGFAEAATRIGGTSRGLLGYSDLRLLLGPTFDRLRTDTNAVADLLASTPLAPTPGQLPPGWEEWIDFRLLPPFEKVAQHFGSMISTAGTDTNGFDYRWHLYRSPAAN